MKYDIKLLLCYWKKHKRQAASLLLIFVVLAAYMFISFSMVRTELRRIYFDGYYTSTSATGYYNNGNGAYNNALYDASDEVIPLLEQSEFVSEYEKVYVSGYAGTDSYNYTMGAYPNENAASMAGFKLRDGFMPQKTGEIAISELALENMGYNAAVGDEINIYLYDHNRIKIGSKTVKIAGIIKDNGTNTHWDTNTKAVANEYEPVVIFNIDDIELGGSKQHIMFRLVNGDKTALWNEETENKYLNFLTECLQVSKCNGYGIGGYDSSFLVYGAKPTEAEDAYLKSEKSYFYQYSGIGAAILMMITLSCALLVILPERMKSFSLLWQIGCPIWRLRRMLIMEWLAFTIVGTVAGLLVAVVGYEALLQIQHFAFGLDVYRSYDAEWGILQITFEPFSAVVASVVISSFAAYIVPWIGFKKLLHNKNQKSQLSFLPSPRRMSGCIAKIFSSPEIKSLQLVSLVLVFTLTCSAYMFFSVNGKDSWSNPQITEQGKFYITDLNLDRRDCDIDCTIEDVYTNFQPGLLDLDMSSGYSYSEEQLITNSGLFKFCYAWADVRMFALYSKDEKVSGLLNLHTYYADGEQEWYGLSDKDAYQMDGAIVVNDAFLKEIEAVSENELSGNGVYVITVKGGSPFKAGEKVSMFSASASKDETAQFGYHIDDRCEFDVEVSDIVNIGKLKNNELLFAILSQFSSDYIVVIPYATAQEVALPRQNFEQFYMQYNDNTTDEQVKQLVRSFHTPDTFMATTTISDCDRVYYEAMLKELVIVFTVFGLLLILSLIGYTQTLKLQVVQRKKQIQILRSLGMSCEAVKKALFKELIKIPVISGIVSIPVIAMVQKFLRFKHDECEAMTEQLYQMFDSTSEEAIRLSTSIIKQQKYFMTNYEMWKVPVWGLFAILFMIVIITIGIIIWEISAKATLIRTED